MLEQTVRYAEVLLPIPVGGTFTYAVPAEMSHGITAGVRVVVQFGVKKIYTALVLSLHAEATSDHSPKKILAILDEKPVVTPTQLKFWRWMADYYMCHPGEVMNAALPAAMKLASETRITLNPEVREINQEVSEKEALILETLRNRPSIPVSEVAKILEQQKTIPLIKTLIDKGLIVSEEEIADTYKPKTIEYVTLSATYQEDDQKLQELFSKLEKKAFRQLEILMTFLRLSNYGSGTRQEVSRHELLLQSKAAAGQFNSLVEKDVFSVYEKTISRQQAGFTDTLAGQAFLTEIQDETYRRIHTLFQEKEVVLLHGVTSSGKTEIYIRLMQDTIGIGKQVLFLLPEIALTTQIVNRLRKYFGSRVGVYHSRFQTNERVDVYRSILESQSTESTLPAYDIILGARSAVFLPFTNLGLVVVDEEHDTSFKQNDPAPRYNGRDAAIYLAHLHGAHVLLGSATPSLESYFNASKGKYGLVNLSERYAGIGMPEIRVVDIREATHQGLMKSHFSSELIEQLKGVLARKEQAILFQNRRGFSLRLECDVCQWMPVCLNCDVTLVYHKKMNQLRCHYCGFVTRIPEKCPDCKSVHIRMKGFGTEKVEEELGIILPEARIVRMDLDTTRSKNALQRIITDFEEGKVDILVGTQMVTKGLDFDHVSLVCILNADNMLSYPDFRSAERSYQLMAQVSGRSGRKNKRGMVIIQTRQPAHTVIRQVVMNDYTGMYEYQLAERSKFSYPPYVRLVLLKIKHKNAEILNRLSASVARELRKPFGKSVLGPEYPMVSRIMNYYIKYILIKVRRDQPLGEVKEQIAEIAGKIFQSPDGRSARLIIDVDPQ